MELSPEERKRIYEEEKALLEEEEKSGRQQRQDNGNSSTNLEPNVAALLCYLGMWLTGIIFLIIEQKNRFVRFHAIQSIVVFAILAVVAAVLSQIPIVGGFFGFTIGVLTIVLWIVLMVSAYRGDLYKLPLAGDIAEKATGTSAGLAGSSVADSERAGKTETPAGPPATTPKSDRAGLVHGSGRGGRITASSFAIAWSIILLVFLNFYSRYIAYYQYDDHQWARIPILTGDYNTWLPILTATLCLSIVAHIILIIYDRYILRETTLIVLNLFGLAVVFTLMTIYPFDFSAIADDTAAAIMPVVIIVILIGVSIGLIIATIVGFIKLIVNAIREAMGK